MAASPVHAVDGGVTGVVFQDIDFDGTRDGASGNMGAEPGVGGVTVDAVDAAGNPVGSAVTAADGTYALAVTGAVSADVRVTFTPPAGYEAGALGSTSGSTVQFVSLPSDTADLAVTRLGQFNADDDPLVAVPLQRSPAVQADPSTTFPTTPALLGFPYVQQGRPDDPAAPAEPAAPIVLATQSDIGSVWGTTNLGTDAVLSAAFIRNGSPLAGTTGHIYRTDVAAAVGGDPNGALWTTIPDAGSSGRDADTFPSVHNWGFDDVAVTSTYRAGLGDIDAAADGSKVYVVNLADRNLYEVAVNPDGSAGAITRIDLPRSLPGATQGCAEADVRPFGLGEHLGTLYVTFTCTAESSQNPANLRGYVYSMNEATRTFSDAPVVEIALDYARGAAATFEVSPAEWMPWGPIGNGYRPEPMLSTVAFDDAGNLSLSIKDRQGDKTGYEYPSGELLRFCWSGTYVLEDNASCGGATGSQPGVGYGPGGGLFYDSRYEFDAAYGHEQTLLGSALQIPGFSGVMATSMTPQPQSSGPTGDDYTEGKHQDGVRRLSGSTGEITGWATVDYPESYQGGAHSDNFSKAGGLGDLSALLALAPVEIGNRVWIDSDRDGIQDPGEAGVAGVTVRLYLPGSAAVIATAVTDADGTYSFSSAAGTSTSAHVKGLALTPNTAYAVRVDDADDFATGPLAGYVPTITKAGGGTNGAIDSNGTAQVAGSVTLSVEEGAATPAANVADHTVDFGFVLPEYDLMITKSLVSVAPYQPGSNVTYALVVRNNGPDVALSGLTVTDRLPAGLTFRTPAATGTDWTCEAPVGNDVTCTWNGPDLLVGDETTAITVNATVNAGVANGKVLVNSAVVRPWTGQKNPETIPVGTTNDGFENGSNVPTNDHPSNNDDSKSITVTVAPPETTLPPTTTQPPDTTLPPTTTQPPDVSVLPPTTVTLPTLPPGATTVPAEVQPPVTPGRLPVTGGNSNAMVYAALVLVILGAGGFLVARRRRTT